MWKGQRDEAVGKRKTISLPWERGADGGALPLPAVTARAGHSPFPTPQNGCGGAIPEGTRRGGDSAGGAPQPRDPLSRRGSPTPLGSGTKQPSSRTPGTARFLSAGTSLLPATPAAAAGDPQLPPDRPLNEGLRRAPTAGRGAAAAAPSLTAHGGTTRSFPLRGNAPPARRPR